ncbi:hypothetical protein ACFC26_21825 [Kitasatospora purpeofusca]|uniref:hypothetical protein n=1 Tax=Kitasatospora purpeofusca TaxID=67352 RepID=UPI0035DC8CA6
MPKSHDAEPTPAMNDSLLTALTSQNHAVHGYAATVSGLIRRRLAEQAQGGEAPGFRLTVAGRLAAVELARKAHGSMQGQVWAAALAEARRLMRLGDDERVQPPRRILTRSAACGAATDEGVRDPGRVLRWAARAILAGAQCRRLDPEGLRVECVHLTGIVHEFIATGPDPADIGTAQPTGADQQDPAA